MSDPSGYEDVLSLDEGNDPQQPAEQREDYLVRAPRSQIRTLQERAKKGDVAEQRAQAAERELAFLKAGIDLSTEHGQFFAEGYKGELTAEAIRTKATAVGALNAPSTPAIEEEVNVETPNEPTDIPLEDGEADLSAERQALAQGAPPDEQAPADPYADAQRAFDGAMEQGAQWKVAAGGMINSLVNAAHRGDQRVILDNHGRSRE